MTKDLLWEIGVEEVPARFLPPVVTQMTKLAEEAFATAGLGYDTLNIYATPRRLTLLVNGLAECSEDTRTEAKGPAVKAAYDADGNPTKALQGFCRGQGIDPADVMQKEINGNLYIYIEKTTPGKPAMELLPALLPPIVDKLYFPKPQRWGYNSKRFIRPVRWMVALFGEEIIPVEFAGIHADRYTRGHRVLGSDHIEITEPAMYLQALRDNYVICDQEERRAMCWEQIQQVAASLSGRVEEDEELLEEVTYLLEYPTALSGRIEDKYLELPDELVITPMREHQRYFPVYDMQGKLLPRFITVRNGDGRFLEIVAEGNEKVLRARLADAEFFYREDLKDNMEDKVEELSAVVFHEKIGTSREKVGRIVALAEVIGRALHFTEEEMTQTRRAAYLAKADLGSRVVYEFPELQGIIGEYYANAAGEDPVVAQAIREHYLPRFAGDELPETKPGMAVSLADKLDSICGFFLVGLVPSGSQDPYALRRAAAGCAQITIRKGLDLPLRDILTASFELLKKDAPLIAEADETDRLEQLKNIVMFMHQRLENMMTEDGISYDVINAVQSVALQKADLQGTMLRAKMLQEYRQSDSFKEVISGFTRATNILRSAKDGGAVAVDPALFTDPAEQALYDGILAVKEEIKPLLEKEDYKGVFDAAGKLTPLVHGFFDAVMVMDKDDAVRLNRIALLKEIKDLTADVGDLSQIVTAAE